MPQPLPPPPTSRSPDTARPRQPRPTGTLASTPDAWGRSPATVGVRDPASIRYDRQRDLARLIPLWPAELIDTTPEGHHRIVIRLRRALREERRRGVAGDWAYDLTRHAGLYRALQAELANAPLPLTSWSVPPFLRDSSPGQETSIVQEASSTVP